MAKPKHKSGHDYIVTVTVTTDAEVTKKAVREIIERRMDDWALEAKGGRGDTVVTKVRVNRVDRQ